MHGQLPAHLVFDSQLTTYANLAKLDKMGIAFITLRRRSPKLLAEIEALPPSAWRGYADAKARSIFRDLLDTPADVEIDGQQVLVRFHRRAHLSIVIASGLLDEPVVVPWWHSMTLRMTEQLP
jgi:hypothetical protein